MATTNIFPHMQADNVLGNFSTTVYSLTKVFFQMTGGELDTQTLITQLFYHDNGYVMVIFFLTAVLALFYKPLVREVSVHDLLFIFIAVCYVDCCSYW